MLPPKQSPKPSFTDKIDKTPLNQNNKEVLIELSSLIPIENTHTKHQNTSFYKKLWKICKLCSLFKKPNGIYHKGNLFYVSKCSVISSFVLVGLVMVYCIYKAE